jgi:hypothetical protein
MRKWLWNICAVALLSLVVATPALAQTVTKTKTKTLPIAGAVTFTSAFSATNGDTITITISPVNPSVTISDVQLVRITPKHQQGCVGCSIAVSGTGDQAVDVTLRNPLPGKSTFHLRLYLSTGEHVGVKVKFGR